MCVIDTIRERNVSLSRRSAKGSPLASIRLKCLECCALEAWDVATCPNTKCPLWSLRFGVRPKASSDAVDIDPDAAQCLAMLRAVCLAYKADYRGLDREDVYERTKKSWYVELRRLANSRAAPRSYDRQYAVLEWLANGTSRHAQFWRRNILSARKFCAQFERLEGLASADNSRATHDHKARSICRHKPPPGRRMRRLPNGTYVMEPLT